MTGAELLGLCSTCYKENAGRHCDVLDGLRTWRLDTLMHIPYGYPTTQVGDVAGWTPKHVGEIYKEGKKALEDGLKAYNEGREGFEAELRDSLLGVGAEDVIDSGAVIDMIADALVPEVTACDQYLKSGGKAG